MAGGRAVTSPDPTGPDRGRLLILASSSPRRRQLLAELGVPFLVVPVDVPEEPRPGEKPIDLAKRLALSKAEAAQAAGLPDAAELIVGADTVVVDRSQPLGKPATPAEAIAMLRRLRGRVHQVIGGVAVLDRASGRAMVETELTRVRLRAMTDEEIIRYVETGDPLDKAGAYAIQNPEFHPVESIEGCYHNVVGLPLCTLAAVLARFGVAVAAEWQPRGSACQCAQGRTSVRVHLGGRRHTD